MPTLRIEGSGLALDGVELPGVFQSIRIGDALNIDSMPIPGQSGSGKQVLGWADATVTFNLTLLSNDRQTAIDQLTQLAGIFHQTDGNAKPKVYTLTHPLAEAFGLRNCLFESLEINHQVTALDDAGSPDQIGAALQFSEYRPIWISRETQASTGGDLPADLANELGYGNATDSTLITALPDREFAKVIADEDTPKETPA